ncbi:MULTISPECIES: hypothetical protein [Bacillus]|uniref:hypothetical protein n=1 Tax=Bacillus TaxID=1386 RepID=UPI0015C4ECCE|nr:MULTISPECIES: hypothetical protein [Bacillus]MBY7113121.1 hypothetical protein [Bacillus sp. 17RED48]
MLRNIFFLRYRFISLFAGQDPADVRKLGGRLTVRKSPIGEGDNQKGWRSSPD